MLGDVFGVPKGNITFPLTQGGVNTSEGGRFSVDCCGGCECFLCLSSCVWCSPKDHDDSMKSDLIERIISLFSLDNLGSVTFVGVF